MEWRIVPRSLCQRISLQFTQESKLVKLTHGIYYTSMSTSTGVAGSNPDSGSPPTSASISSTSLSLSAILPRGFARDLILPLVFPGFVDEAPPGSSTSSPSSLPLPPLALPLPRPRVRLVRGLRALEEIEWRFGPDSGVQSSWSTSLSPSKYSCLEIHLSLLLSPANPVPRSSSLSS